MTPHGSGTMLLTAHQQESWQLALVCLLVMLFTTIVLHTVLSFSDKDRHPKPLSPAGELSASFAGFFSICIWVIAFAQWFLFLGGVSSSLRNIALLYGVIAANGGAVYMLLRPGNAGYLYVLYSLLPMYLGMATVSFSVFTPEMLLPKLF